MNTQLRVTIWRDWVFQLIATQHSLKFITRIVTLHGRFNSCSTIHWSNSRSGWIPSPTLHSQASTYSATACVYSLIRKAGVQGFMAQLMRVGSDPTDSARRLTPSYPIPCNLPSLMSKLLKAVYTLHLMVKRQCQVPLPFERGCKQLLVFQRKRTGREALE